MKDLSNLVKSLKVKAEKLVEKHNLLLKEKDSFSDQVDKLKHELSQKNEQIKELEDRVHLLKIAGSVENKSTKDVKLKINEMVREIDKCIAQISR